MLCVGGDKNEPMAHRSGCDHRVFNANRLAGSIESIEKFCCFHCLLIAKAEDLNSLRVHSPRLAANSSYRRKPVSRKADWIPCQARNDEARGEEDTPLLAAGSFILSEEALKG